MTLLEMYEEAKKENVVSAWVLIEFLVFEKKALTFMDDVSKLNYYYDPRFRNKMNEYLNEYMKQRGISAAA